MRLLPLLWSHRRPIVYSAVAAVIAAVPFGLMRPATSTSTSTVLLSPNEPAIANGHNESVLSLRMQQYTDNDFEGAVDKALGKQANNVSSVSAGQSKTDPIVYDVSVSAGAAKTATAAVKVANKVLVDEYGSIIKGEVDRIERDVTGQLGPLTARKNDLDGQVAARKTELDSLQQQVAALDNRMASIRAATAKDALSGSTAATAAADRLIAPIQAQKDALLPALTAKRTQFDQATTDAAQVEGDRTTLQQALSNAKKTYVSSLAATQVSAPDTPVTNTLLRLVEAVGFGAVLGLALACISIVWLERSPVWRWVRSRFRRAVGEDAGEEEPRAPLREPAPRLQPQARRWPSVPAQPNPAQPNPPPRAPTGVPDPAPRPSQAGQQERSPVERSNRPAEEPATQDAPGPPFYVRDV